MPPFRFRIPFFSSSSPSRVSSPPPPPPTPPPSRPPFRPAGIAQPSKPAATLPETKSKVPPPLSRAKSNVAAMASSSSASASQSSSRGAATPTRLAKETNKSGSPLKKPEPPRAEEENVIMKEKPLREIEEDAGENINRVKQKPLIARSEPKEAEEAQEQRKKAEVEKLAVEERNLKTAQELQKGKETEKFAVEQKMKFLRQDMEENSKSAHEQEKRKETEKLASQEINRPLLAMGREDATQSKTTRHIAAASESTRSGPRDLPERKLQKRTDIHKDDNHQKNKGKSTSNHGNVGVKNGETSSSMSRKIKEDIRDGISKLTWGKSNGDEKSVSVYTLTGENRGATMAVNSEKDKKDGEVRIRRGYRSNPEESLNTTATETEGERRRFKGQNPKDVDEEEEEKTSVWTYVNGNTQGINNSIVCDSSVQENDPGIHMSLEFEQSRKKDETISPRETVMEKKPETVKNEPRVRRRCLRGLLAESSESDPENPLKPRRHGCRFTCKDKDIKNT